MHKHWVKIVAVVVMLAAMAWYLLSLDEQDAEILPPEAPAPAATPQ
ncbi:MAG: hypothetical protein JNG90_00025 [Planctomycetaceae bacterium]|nr:hypothetical protein [Planctomycetaceae bacterium]